MKTLWIAALLAIRGQEVHLKTEAYLAEDKKAASLVADHNCQITFPVEDGFSNHMTSVSKIPRERLKAIVSANEFEQGEWTMQLNLN
jgi:hypothetical protein